jgi:hypothetical protein
MLAWDLLFLLGNANKKFTSYKVSPSRENIANVPVHLIEGDCRGTLRKKSRNPRHVPSGEEDKKSMPFFIPDFG